MMEEINEQIQQTLEETFDDYKVMRNDYITVGKTDKVKTKDNGVIGIFRLVNKKHKTLYWRRLA